MSALHRHRPMKTTARLALALALVAPAAHAGPGHDHGEAPPAATAHAQPRFAASSDLFELVGVLDGKTLTLYLDRAATNEPRPAATVELELGGRPLKPQAQADGSYTVALPAPLEAGVHAVAATVTDGDDVDLLAAELDVHGEAHDAPAAGATGQRWGAAVGAVLGLGLLLGLGVAGRKALARRRAAGFGGAA